MTGTTRSGTKSSSNLQPTKLTSRRGDAKKGKTEDQSQVSKQIPRDIFHPDVLFPSTNSSNKGEANGAKDNNIVNVASKVGLGPAMLNLKPQHFYCKKKSETPISLEYYKRKYGNKSDEVVSSQEEVLSKNEDSALRLCKSMKKLSIFQEDENKNRKVAEIKLGKNKNLMQSAFKKFISLKNAYESGQEVTFLMDELKKKTYKKCTSEIRKTFLKNWKSPENVDDIHNGVLRSLFCWSLPTSTRWKDVEEQISRWKVLSRDPSQIKNVSLEEAGKLLKVTVEQIKNLQFHPSFAKVVEVLKGHMCHASLPWLTTLEAVSELQQQNIVNATKCSAESQGTFLHSEIVDKHICYISRNEDSNSAANARSSFSQKAELFRRQIFDTLSFAKEPSSFSKAISLINPNWNIIQITSLLPSKNRFYSDLCGRRSIPELLLSALTHIPKDKERSIFTTFCKAPPTYEGSLMSHGIMEEFQRILDRNLVISDDSIVISRREYWEERNKHNQAMKSVIDAMEEDWIGPWNFVLPGHTKHVDIQDKICSKIVHPTAKKYKLSSDQKLVLYKLTENYKYLESNISAALETVVSFILNEPEINLGTLCKKIREIGIEVPPGDRHPTILVIDQDLEVYPWESMSCLVNTDVTRMPSLNLIQSNYNFVTSLRPSFPDIVDANSCTFVLNPDKTLPNVQKRLESYFTEHKQWVPIVARPPQTKEVQECLENQDIFLYNGHGAGSNFYPDYAIQKLVCKAVPLLMGCASAQAHYSIPRAYGSSIVHSYFLAGCPSVVGYLWEVTDAECDRITVDLIERWLPNKDIRPPKIIFFDQDANRTKEKCLSTAMRLARKAATQFLTECAIVCYGLPINTSN